MRRQSWVNKNLTTVTSLNITPPANTNYYSFYNYGNATLYVPLEAIEAYRAANGWKYFGNIQAVEISGINSTECDLKDQPNAIYDLNGRRLYKPQKGINIINGKKVLVK